MVRNLLRNSLPPSLKGVIHVCIYLLRNPRFIPLSFTIWKIFSTKLLGNELKSAMDSSSLNSLTALELESLRKTKRLVDLLASIHPNNPLCLPRTLALAIWMKKSNLPFQVKVGWRSRGLAHTWIEVNGNTLDPNSNWQNDTQEILRIG